MNHYLPLEIPVEINGQTVVLASDPIPASAEDVLPSSIPLAPALGQPKTYIAENSIRILRNEHLGIPIYGAWQMLFASGLIQLGTESLYAYFTNEDHSHGSYLVVSPSGQFSGSIMGGHALASPGMSIDLSRAIVLGMDRLADLTLPLMPAMTPMEIATARRGELRTAAVRNGTVIAGVIVFGLLAELSIGYLRQSQHETLADKRQKIAALEAQLDALKANHLVPPLPLFQARLRAHLSKIEDIYAVLDRSFIPRSTLSVPFLFFDHAKGRAVVSPTDTALDWSGFNRAIPDSLHVTYHPTGMKAFGWSLSKEPDQ